MLTAHTDPREACHCQRGPDTIAPCRLLGKQQDIKTSPKRVLELCSGAGIFSQMLDPDRGVEAVQLVDMSGKSKGTHIRGQVTCIREIRTLFRVLGAARVRCCPYAMRLAPLAYARPLIDEQTQRLMALSPLMTPRCYASAGSRFRI